MTRPRKSLRPAESTPASAAQGTDVDREIAQERLADRLVDLAAARLRDTIDAEDPANARYFDWLAAEARAAQSPEERARTAHEASVFAARLLAQMRANGASGHQAPDPAIDCVAGAPVEHPPGEAAGEAGVREASRRGQAPRYALAVAAGAGRELWDEPAVSWIDVPDGVAVGPHVALTVQGDSMEPLLHAGDTILVRLGTECAVGDIVVAHRPDDGHVVKRVAARRATELVLASLNSTYGDIVLTPTPGTIVGTVVLRWCAHEESTRPPR